MMKGLWGDKKPSGLVYDALEETCRMLALEERMFHAACDALLAGQEPAEDVVHEDEDIDVGERMVRRMVFEHLTMNPDQDLPASLALVSIVHDVERVGDYSKSLLELVRWCAADPGEGKYRDECQQIREMIEPMFGQTLNALQESDPDLARAVMRQHLKVKTRTDEVIEKVMEAPEVHHDAVLFSVASRFLRRVSAHLSNIASSIANPFDKLGGDEADAL